MNCAVCKKPRTMTGALCAEHEAVTAEFTDAQWNRVEAMTTEKADDYLRGMANRRRKKRGNKWWEAPR